MRATGVRVLALLLATALVLAGCSTTVTGTPQPVGDVAGGGRATGAVPAGLESFYAQTVTWGSCAGYATASTDEQSFADPSLDCTRVEVPLYYADPTGRTASIALLRLRATGESTGSLLVNPGGPGGSGMSLAANLVVPYSATPLAQHVDLVGFDPRGVGASTPAVDCLTDVEADAQRADDDADTSPAGIAQTEQEAKDYAATCSERVGDDVLAHVGTREVVQDLDVIRSVLGDEQLSYVGFSYGTRIGTAYAEKFPANVRALVLDGALDPTASTTEEVVGQAKGFQGAFDAYAKDCAKQSSCPLGTDPARSTARYQALVDPLLETPAATSDPRGLSYADATTGTITALYSPELWRALTQGLTELAAGRGNTLLALADVYSGRDGTGHYTNQDDAFTAIRCVDDPPVTDRAELDAADTAYRKAAPFLDDGRGSGNAPLDACAFWPVPPTSTPHTPQVAGLAPPVVISTTGDPATPYQAGVALAQQLGGSLVTYRGTQHTAFLSGVPCVDDAVFAYLLRLTLPADGLTCGP